MHGNTLKEYKPKGQSTWDVQVKNKNTDSPWWKVVLRINDSLLTLFSNCMSMFSDLLPAVVQGFCGSRGRWPKQVCNPI